MLRRVVAGKLDQEMVARYTVLSGSFCLLKYVENCRDCSITPQSLRYHKYFAMLKSAKFDNPFHFHLSE